MGDAPQTRDTVFVTHAAPEDNDFALWLSSKLAIAGYRVWVDKQRLRGGDDFWSEIDRMLRNCQADRCFHRERKQAGCEEGTGDRRYRSGPT